MDSWYVAGANLIRHLQDVCEGYDNFFALVSVVADPAKYYVWAFPVAFALDTNLGLRVLLATACSECLNTNLKWILREHRPFWWVKLFSKDGIELRQTHQSCETGPGSPSGHVMVSIAVLYIVIVYALRKLKDRKSKGRFCAAVWPTYFAFMMTVCASRAFIAAHFPHQCLLGAVCGVANGYIFSRIEVETWSPRHYLACSAVVTATTLTVFTLMSAIGPDPNETVNYALQACNDPKYVTVTTNALYGVMRQVASPLGLWFALRMPDCKSVLEGASKMPWTGKLLAGGAGLAAGKILLSVPMPSKTVVVYTAAVMQYFFFTFTVAYGIPYFMSRWRARVEKAKSS
uniref:Glucose-6-phosphatase n=1 Tax=Ornithodoros turicata TaxID=34597 RepID=A0A2R5LL03_9ACAR